MNPKPPRPKPCKVCKQKFQPTRQIQPVCDSYECKVKYAEAHALKANKKRIAQEATFKRQERKKTKEARLRIKTRSEWLKEAQNVVNKFIRLRDQHLPCISCGRFHDGQWHAGHYRTVGSAPELRFNELNIHKQCAPCNNHLSGNIVAYRQGLCDRIGVSNVEWLEGKHEPLKLSIEDIKALKAHYTQRCKELIKLQGE